MKQKKLVKYLNAGKKVIYIKRFKYKLKWGAILSSILNVGILLSSIKIFFMILFRINGFGSLLSSFFGYDEKIGWYFIINRIYNNGNGIGYLWIALLIDLIVIILMMLWLVKKNAKRKILIIEHSSLQRMNFSYDEKELVDYAYKRFSVNQFDTLNDENTSTEEKVLLVIKQISAVVPEILKFVDKGYQLGYAGIANIPATFMLGYELGDENKKLVFHKRRDNVNDDNFHLLSDEPRQLKFISNERKNNMGKSGRVLVLVQLTQPIKEVDLKDVLEDNDYIIKYEIPQTINYDIVDSARQINEYTNKILSDIAEIQKTPNITQIKICIAASGEFVFSLGTKFSKTQNKDIIIFHYQNYTYPWGINVTKKAPVVIKET